MTTDVGTSSKPFQTTKSFKNVNNAYLEMGHGGRILVGYLKRIRADEFDERTYRQEAVVAALLDQEGHVEIPHAEPFRHLDLSERTWKCVHSSSSQSLLP